MYYYKPCNLYSSSVYSYLQPCTYWLIHKYLHNDNINNIIYYYIVYKLLNIKYTYNIYILIIIHNNKLIKNPLNYNRHYVLYISIRFFS